MPGNNRGNIVSVVIKPIHHDVDLEELKEMIKARENLKVQQMERLDSFVRERRTPSGAVKLDFEGETRPEKVFIGVMSYMAHPHVRAPLRCFRCQTRSHGQWVYSFHKVPVLCRRA